MFALLSYLLSTSFVEAQELTVQTMDMVRRKYLWLEDLEAKTALISAAEELEMHIPWIIVRQTDTSITMHVGQQEPFHTVGIEDVNFDNVEVKLFELLLGVTKNAPLAIDEELDVELILLDGFAREMDRYSVMMYRDQLTNFNERISGNFSGIGCRVQKNENGLEIQEVFPDGPASLMGLEEGDIITQVDSVSLNELTLQQGVDRLRGETGSVVAIQYMRADQLIEMSLVRSRVRIPNVHWTVQDDVGVITIRSFSEQTMRFLNQALDEFDGRELNGLILDLRNNGGGSMLQSCKVVDRFVTSGTTIKTVGRDGKAVSGLMKQYINRNSFTEPKLPMVVLINGNSASASEIVSGSLKLLDRALVIGQRSYGKGVVQTAADLRGGDDPVALKLTIAQYLLMNDYSVHEQDGVEPHIKIGRMDMSEMPFVSILPEPNDLMLLQDGEDKELAFAIDVLNRSESSKVSVIKEVATETIQQWSAREDSAIEAQMKEHGIDWGVSNAQAVQNLQVEVLSDTIATAGEEMTLQLRIHNSGEEITQSLLWLQAENSTSPWDDVVVPVGIIKEGASQDVTISLDIPVDTIPRYDKLQPMLLRSCCAEVELDPIYIQVSAGIQHTLEIQAQIKPVESNEYQFEITTKNTGRQDLTELKGRIIWPIEARQIRMTNNEWTVDVLAPGQVSVQTLDFISYETLESLPEVLLRIDSQEQDRLFRQPLEPTVLQNAQGVVLRPPVVHGIPPVSASVDEPLVFEHVVEDDGTVEVYEAWFNNEKIHWQTDGGVIQVSLDLETGHNNLYLEVSDNLGLVQKTVFTIFGLASQSSEAHLGENAVETEESQE